MKVITSLFTAALLLIVTACGGSMNTVEQPDYEVALADLQQVQRIFGFRLDNWEYINDQTLFVDTDPSRHYLLVLQTPNPDLDKTFNLRVVSTDGDVYAGSSRISGEPNPMSYIIESIYQIDQDQREEIRARILEISQKS